MTIYRRTAEALFSEVGSDIVAIHVERGQCFGMEKVAADVWRLLEKPRDLEAICADLVVRYDVDPAKCHGEIGEYLDQLCQEGLVSAAT